MIQVLFQVLIYFRKQNIFIFLGECIPFHVYIIVCQFQGILNIFLVCAVENRGGYVKSKRCCCKAQVDLQHLSDVHTGRHTQRVQHDVQRTSVRQERHILYRKYTGNDTLVSVTTSLTVRYFQGSITYFSCFLAKDGTEQTLLCGQLSLSLRSYFSDQNITGTYLCTDADDSTLVQVF